MARPEITETEHIHCPSCGREVTRLEDYPLVEVVGVEILELPEGIMDGIVRRTDITDQVHVVVGRDDVQQYLSSLREAKGALMATESLLPPFPKDSYFKRVYNLAGSGFYLGFDELSDKPGTSTLGLWKKGPNFGSGGGPSIIRVVELAEIKYKGKFNSVVAPVMPQSNS